MPIFRNIMLPLDLADVPGHLDTYAKAMAQRFKAKVHIVFVAPLLQHYAAMYVPHPSIRQIEREIVDGAEKLLHDAGVTHIWSTDSIAHSSNVIELAPLLSQALREA